MKTSTSTRSSCKSPARKSHQQKHLVKPQETRAHQHLFTTSYLGQPPIWNWLTANTALANTAGMRQNEHKDSMFDHPRCPYYIIANVPLCDFSTDNGATEFWLGSHAGTTLEDQQPVTDATRATWAPKDAADRIPWISDGAKEARRAVRPPVQPEVLRGDIMIRDLRTWHAGMPNHSDRHRIMLGLGYQVSAWTDRPISEVNECWLGV